MNPGELFTYYVGTADNCRANCRDVHHKAAEFELTLRFVTGILKSMGIEKGINPLDPQYGDYIDQHWREYYQSVKAMKTADFWSIVPNGGALYEASTSASAMIMLSILKIAIRYISKGDCLTGGVIAENERCIAYMCIISHYTKTSKAFMDIQLVYDKANGRTYMSISD